MSDAVYQRPAELLQRLIRFDTTNPPGHERECVAYVRALLSEAGLQTTLVAQDPARPNLVARLSGQGQAPPLLLQGHVDVVPAEGQRWLHPPFEGTLVDGYLWGRGALDMKGGVAVMLAALLRARAEGLVPAGDVLLAVLSDEEASSVNGARYLVENHPDLFQGVRYAIGELGGFSLYVAGKRFYPIMVAEKALCRVRMILRGSGGHGAFFVRGSAMAKLGQVLQRLERQPLPIHVTPVARDTFEAMAAALPPPADSAIAQLLDPATAGAALERLGPERRVFEPMLRNLVNPTLVRGGTRINVIPSEIVLEMDGRLLPGFGPADLEAELRRVVGPSVEIELTPGEPASAVPDMGLFDTLAAILRDADPAGVPVPYLFPAVTDGRFFARLGIQTYGFLPMKLPEGFDFLETIHAADERIPVEALEFGAEAMYRLLQCFGQAGTLMT